LRITLVTAFPDMVRTYLSGSVLGRGIASGLLDVEVLNLRDFAEGSYRQVDDYAFGGGGMVLMAEPLARAVESAAGRWGKPHVLLTSPQGVRLDQTLVETLSGKEHLLIVCGHYEGVDERFVRRFVDLEVSLGDFVLTGGELPALAIVDAVARLVPGVVGCARSVVEDSFYLGLLDCPHETRPADWRGEGAEPVLLGGDPAAIHRWRRREQVRRTLARRPDLVARAGLMPYLSRGAYVLLACAPVRDRGGERGVAAVTPPDLHDLARTCRRTGCGACWSTRRFGGSGRGSAGSGRRVGGVPRDGPPGPAGGPSPRQDLPRHRQALGWGAS
jgi:tRNA (guanine37-N1)-methyltransferase